MWSPDVDAMGGRPVIGLRFRRGGGASRWDTVAWLAASRESGAWRE